MGLFWLGRLRLLVAKHSNHKRQLFGGPSRSFLSFQAAFTGCFCLGMDAGRE
jgi:hypothetical protein